MTIENEVSQLRDDVKFLKDLVLKVLDGKGAKADNGRTVGVGNSGKCKYCPADVVWITSKKGKPVPCDPGLVDGSGFGAEDWWIEANGQWHKGPEQGATGYTKHDCQKKEVPVAKVTAGEEVTFEDDDQIPF